MAKQCLRAYSIFIPACDGNITICRWVFCLLCGRQMLHFSCLTPICLTRSFINYCTGKAVPLQAQRGPQGSRKLRFPDYVTTAQDGGRLINYCTGKAVPLQAQRGPEGSRKLRLPDYVTTAQDGGRLINYCTLLKYFKLGGYFINHQIDH